MSGSLRSFALTGRVEGQLLAKSQTIWIWIKRGALFAVIVGVAYGIAMQFPQYRAETWSKPPIENPSPFVFVSTLAAQLAFLYFWFREDARK
jgi:hypothetical protein